MTENKLVAEVNGKKIYQSDVYELMANIGDQQRFSSDEGFNVLADELVNQELLLEDAKKKGYDKDDEFLEELNIVKDNMLKNYAMHKVFEQVEVTDDEVKKYYEDNKESLFSPITYSASHILVEDEALAKEILDKLNEGLDFEEAAREYSIDPSKDNGGNLGTFPKGVMVKEFQEGLDGLKVGEISNPVRSDFGYHIIKLHDKNEDARSFEELEEQVRATYEMGKRQDKYLDILNSLYKDAEVKKYY